MVSREQALKTILAEGEPYELEEADVYGRPCRVFRHAPPTMRELFISTASDLPFLIYEDERLTFEETWAKACQLATLLVQRYGVRQGDRVAISMRNYPEWVISYSAVTSIGAVAVALNALWQPNEMDYALRDCGAKVLIADQERIDRYTQIEHPPERMAVLAVRPTRPLPLGIQHLNRALEGVPYSPLPWFNIHPDDDATIFYTSGSTGHPKGVVCSHRSIISALLSWEVEAQAAVMTGSVDMPFAGEDGAMEQGASLLAVPLFHVTGSNAIYLGCYRAQRRLVCMYKWDVTQAMNIIERERITSFVATPAMTGDLVHAAATSNRDLSSLQLVGGGGAPRAPEQVRAINKGFQTARPNTGWGMTETNAIGTSIAGEDYVTHPDSSGRCSVVLDIKIIDEEGNTLPAYGRGELLVRGASMFRGYWNRPDATAEVLDTDGWMRTGDVAYMDEDGFLYIVDRIKDLVIRGGENIGCGAVEAAILEHPDILETSVYGVPDERLGEEVGATIYATRPMDEAEVRAFLEPRLARFEIPRYFHFMAEPLPRTATGKIFKRQLRDEARDRHERGET